MEEGGDCICNCRKEIHIYNLFVVNWEGQRADWLAAIFDAGGILGEIIL